MDRISITHNSNAEKMKHSIVSPQLVLTFSIICLHFSSAENHLPEFEKWEVTVVNGLSNDERLLVHCKSNDDDLGVQSLSSGTDFGWSFRENFVGNTLFWCYARKNTAHVGFKAFWNDASLKYKCLWKNCVWVAKDDGIYVKDLRSGFDEFKHEWEPEL